MKSSPCKLPEGVEIKPDGIHPVSPHLYKTKEIHRNVTVEVSQCTVCGDISIGWYRQEDTESEYIEELSGG